MARKVIWRDNAGNKAYKTTYKSGRVVYEVKNKHGKTVNIKDTRKVLRKLGYGVVKTHHHKLHHKHHHNPFNLFGY